MTGTATATAFSVEIFVEQDQVLPMRIGGVSQVITVARPSPFMVFDKQTDEPAGNFVCHLLKVHENTRPGGAFDFEVIPVKIIVSLQSLHDQIVDRKPDRSSPVGVSTEKMSVPFAGNIIDAVFTAVGAENVRMCGVDLGKGTD